MEQFWITLLSIAFGAVGYYVVTFHIQPILRYRDIKYRVAADLVFFANALELQKKNGSFRDDTQKRQENNRRCASDLEAIAHYLPRWYQWWLNRRDENPMEASRYLIGLSNSNDSDNAKHFTGELRKHLRIPSYKRPEDQLA